MAKTKQKRPTERQKVFIAGVVSGLSRSEAYMAAYKVKSLDVARACAGRLMLSNAIVKEEVSKRLDSGIEEAWEILKADAAGAAQGLVDMRKHATPEHSVMLRATEAVLERVGVKATEKIEVSGIVALQGIWDNCVERSE